MKLIGLFFFALLFCGITNSDSFAQTKMTSSKRIRIAHVSKDFPIDNLGAPIWNKASDVNVTEYWSGKPAPRGRHFIARLLWSKNALYVRFEANQTERLIVNDKPDLTKKARGLWDRDVCEIFIAPNKAVRNKYFEFEIAPTGEWMDLGITVTPTKRKTDLDYVSRMQAAAKIEKGKVVMAIKVPWKALAKTPKAGDIWLGNLFRCVGKDPTRGYLSWQATRTRTPNFHVPERFGEFEFTK